MAGLVTEEEKGKFAEEVTKEVIVEGEDMSVEEVRKKLHEAKVGYGDHDKTVKDEKFSVQEENVKMDVEPKTGVSFPVQLADGKQLCSLGLRSKKVIAFNLNIYAFGIYADTAKLKELLKAKFGKAPPRPTKELYEAVINSDIGMVVKMIIVFRGLTMNLVRKNFDEGLGGSLKKLNEGQNNDDLLNKVLGSAKNSTKLPSGSIIEITRFPGYILQTKVKGELISKVESELLCRAYFSMYLADDPIDKEAKERFGNSLLSLF